MRDKGFGRVTEILDAAGLGFDPSGIDPDVLVAVRARGSAVHEAIAAAHYGYDVDLAPEHKPFMGAYGRFVDETKHEAIASEYEMIDTRWRVIGHLDRVGWVHVDGFTGHRTIFDFKTGGAKGVEYQLAAYVALWNATRPGELVDRAAAVALRRDGTYRFLPVDLKGTMAHGFTPEQVWYAAVTLWYARQGEIR